jgi:hypothetical protein
MRNKEKKVDKQNEFVFVRLSKKFFFRFCSVSRPVFYYHTKKRITVEYSIDSNNLSAIFKKKFAKVRK